MKTVKAILSVMAVLLLPRYADALDLGSVRISFLEGDVQMRTTEADDWVPAAINTPLDEGDELWVPEGGRMEFQLNTGTAVRLDQNSALQILTLESKSSQFYLTEGHVYVDHNAPRGHVLQFDTPVSSLRAYDRSVFRVDVPDQYTDVSVFRGSVDAEGSDGRTRVSAGRTLTLGEGREAELSPVGRADGWQNWNTERDRRFALRGDSYRYLPEELRVYSSDLDDNGRWVQVPEYGYVWIPRSVSTDWTPYRTGRWMWRGGDYVWIGSEPWGWTPYHYGRWAHAPRIGWFWVPPQRRQVYWGPGYVGWVRTRDHVAWVPLAPREVYYGYGNYGPNSVDIRKRNVREINITNITYKNVQVNNSVTIINNNSFVTGRREVVNVRENPFLTEKINVGRPDIKPEKASFAPVVKTIESAKLPPRQVTKIAVKDLKQERRLVKEQNQSVINKGEPVKSLVVKAVEQPKSPTEKVQERKQKGASAAAGETPRVKSEEKSASSSAPPAETKATNGGSQATPEPAAKQAESAREKAQERQQTQMEKGKSGIVRDIPRVKSEEKSASPAAPPETKATKGGSQSIPEPAAKQAESAREKAQERQQTQMEKGKSGAAPETPRAKSEEKSAGPGKAAETKETKGRNIPASVSETKTGSTVEPRDRKSPRAEEKATTPVKPPEAIERKNAKQSGPDEKERPAPSAVKASKASDEAKGGKQTAADKKATKNELDGKGKSDETKEEKVERKQKSLD
jgi:hypothetical protein